MPTESNGLVVTKQTAINIGLVVVLLTATAVLTSRLENISVRLEQLERKGSEPMQSILAKVITMQDKLDVVDSRANERWMAVQKAIVDVEKKIQDHMDETKAKKP